MPAPRWLLSVMVACSAALHLAFAVVVSEAFDAPDLGIEVQIPIDVELGLSSEVAMAPFAPPPAPAPAPAPAAVDTSAGAGEKPPEKPKKKRDYDAGVADAGAPIADAGSRDAGPSLMAQTGEPGARLPPGAQIAVRVDMARIRTSPIARDVRGVLAAIPDWKALLDGSGIDPVDQLDRLMIATPNLQREKVVIAGRYVGDLQVVERAVEMLAAARGIKPEWRAESGVRVAPWANADETPRVIALVGPQHFTISRAEDLPRLLAIAAARVEEQAKQKKGTHEGEAPSAPPEHPADALLSMEDNEGLSLEVDGVEQFIRRTNRGVPLKLRLSALEVPGPAVELRARLVYQDAEKAADALRFWDGVRQAYARNALVMLMGLAQPLVDGKLEQVDTELRARIVLSVEQTRLILGYVRELFTPVPSPSAVPPGPPGSSASTH